MTQDILDRLNKEGAEHLAEFVPDLIEASVLCDFFSDCPIVDEIGSAALVIAEKVLREIALLPKGNLSKDRVKGIERILVDRQRDFDRRIDAFATWTQQMLEELDGTDDR